VSVGAGVMVGVGVIRRELDIEVDTVNVDEMV
jgi:hypothetical protein